MTHLSRSKALRHTGQLLQTHTGIRALHRHTWKEFRSQQAHYTARSHIAVQPVTDPPTVEVAGSGKTCAMMRPLWLYLHLYWERNALLQPCVTDRRRDEPTAWGVNLRNVWLTAV